MNYINIIYYIVSIASIILFVLSVQFKKKKNILLLQIAASFSYMIVYVIKSAWSGVAIEAIEQVKDIAFINYEKNNKKIPFYILLFFILLLITVSIIFYDGPLSILPLVINIAYFVSTYFKNPKYIRIIMLINGFLWTIYNLYVQAYIIVIGNVLEIISAFIALKRFDKV